MNKVVKSISILGISFLGYQCENPVKQASLTPIEQSSSGFASHVRTTVPTSGDLPSGLGNYSLCYQDLFEGTKLNTEEWTYRAIPRLGGLNLKDQVVVSDGVLKINYDTELINGSFLQHKAGGIISKSCFGYGFYEARVKLYTATNGLHQSFWLMGLNKYKEDAVNFMERGEMEQLVNNDKIPEYNQTLEIDGFEQDSKDDYLVWNYHTYIPEHSALSTDKYRTIAKSKGEWFRVGWLWEPGKVTWYYKSEAEGSTWKQSSRTLSEAFRVFSPQNILLTALATPDHADWYRNETRPVPKDAAMLVDYFKYYAKTHAGINLVGNQSFEYNNPADLAGNYPDNWIRARTNQNIASNSKVVRDGTRAQNGERYLLHQGKGRCTTKQVLNHLPNGTYTLTAYVKKSGVHDYAMMRLLQQGEQERSIYISNSDWTKVSISGIRISNNEDITIAFSSETANPNATLLIDNISLVAQ